MVTYRTKNLSNRSTDDYEFQRKVSFESCTIIYSLDKNVLTVKKTSIIDTKSKIYIDFDIFSLSYKNRAC